MIHAFHFLVLGLIIVSLHNTVFGHKNMGFYCGKDD